MTDVKQNMNLYLQFKKGMVSISYNNLNQNKIRVVVYARVSTEHEAQINALENQLEWYEFEVAKHPEWEVVGKYIDEGITGTSANKRPEFLRMLRDAKTGKFDLIITREVSRFARNTVDTLQYTRELKAMGVGVFFINDGIRTLDCDGELRLTIMASLAQEESRKTSDRVKAGQKISRENGVFYGNGNILGYDRIVKIIDGTNKKSVEFIINPEQAETVRMIFDMYLSGMGLTQIKDELERLGRKTAMGKTIWNCTVISYILKNTFYCGIITYGKEYVDDFLSQKRLLNHGEKELFTAKGSHEPIVTVEEFDTVQKILSSKRSGIKNLSTGRRCHGKCPPKNTWSKLLLCSCGNSFNRRSWSRSSENKYWGYQCYSARNSGSYNSRLKRGLPVDGICQSPMIPEWKLLMMANYIFTEYLPDSQNIIELAMSILKKHLEGINDATDVIEAKKSKIKKLRTGIDNLMDMYSVGEIDRDTYRSKAQKNKDEIKALEAEIENLGKPKAEAEEEGFKDDENKLEFLNSTMKTYAEFKGGYIPESIVEAFIRKIVVSKDSYDWYLRFADGGKDPIQCVVNGKRQSTASVSETDAVSPSLVDNNTGSY